jgi:DNA polymerase-3 subunit alpha
VADSFTHLHVHTEYSMLDGAARLDELVAAAAADGQPALGITDHGNMYGILDFYRACKDQGVKPILGTEAYMAHDHRTERIAARGKMDDSGGEGEGGKKPWYHLTLLAESEVGYKNLIQLASRSFMEGYYRKPKIDWELLEEHSEGLIATTGCLGGHVLQAMVPKAIMDPDKQQADPLSEDERFDNAVKLAGRLQDIFGRDNLFVELQDHGIPAQQWSNPRLAQLAKAIRAPLLATNDSHYVHREDALAHDALLCVQTNSLVSDKNRFKFHGDDHYLKSAEEMRYLFRELPTACDNTLWVAERCEVEIEFGKPQLPNFPLPPGFATDDDYLRHLVFEGAKKRWGDTLDDKVTDRLLFELKVIGDMGFSSYFLITWDLIKHARDNEIRVGPGRGSAAGCAVAYTLWITDLDPIKYDLLFERFLNPSRISMPDIDMDFDTRYRDEMIRYAAERYGRENVAQIITFGTIKARQAVRDAARVLGHDYGTGDRIAKAMPPLIMGRDTPLYACLEEHPKYVDGYKMATEIREMYSSDPISKEVIDVAKGLEGLRRSDGIHAAAVVITKEPLTTYLPIQRKPEPGKPIEEAPVVTQYEMHGVEDLGLLKMDFLGLRNLDIISDTLDLIEMTRGDMPDIDNVDLEDAKTFELLQAGQTVGVFQLESPPMRALMRSLAPDSFEDVAALVALYRPGPMAANMHNDYADRKNGRKPIEYLHPDAEEILGTTYGLCLTGDTVVVNAATGVPTRLDRVDPGAGFSVQGVDNELRPVVRPVTHWVCNGERETVRLTLADGHQITGTPDHPVLTERGWVGLGDLRSDDHVAVPKAILAPERTAPVGVDRMRVLGNLLGDGSVRAGAVALHNDDRDILDQFVSAVRRSFPRTEVVHDDSDGRSRLRCTRKSGRRSDLSEWLRSLGIATGGVAFGSADKFVPPCVFAAPDEELEVLLAALWDCDGHVNEQLAVYTTVSSRLADDVVLLLRRLGMDASHYRSPYIRPRDGTEMTAHQVAVFDGPRFGATVGRHLASRRKREVTFRNVPHGRTLGRGAVAEMLSASGVSLPATCRAAGVSRLHLQPSRIAALPRVRESVVASVSEVVRLPELEQMQRVHWIRVGSVEPNGVEHVFDITVEEVHNFIANGMVVHNCIYQESVMRLAQKFAGYTLADADLLRKAAGKKSREIMQKERAKFVDGCERTGYGRELGDAWFDIIEPFADYAFNRSHSVGYGFIAYQIAYLKANYPAEYMSALLTSVKSNLDKAAVYLAECRAMEIPVTVADVNRSLVDFAPELRRGDDGIDGAEIVFGMSAVRGVGTGHCELIIAEREANGAYADFYDFCERVDLGVLNKKTVEALIKAGAFDSVGHPRQGLLMVFESIIDRTIARRKEAEAGVMSLFDSMGGDSVSTSGGGGFGFDEREEIPDVEFPKAQKLAFEKEMLGLYVSDHPLFGAEDFLSRRTEVGLDALPECEDGAIKTVGGVITNLQRKWTKKGDLMGVFVLEDLKSNIETMVFPRTMTEHGHKLEDDAIVLVKARVDKRDDTPKLIAMEIEVVEGVSDAATPFRLRVMPNRLTAELIAQLKEILLEHPGDHPVLLHLGDDKVLRLPPAYGVDAETGLVSEIRVLLGPAALVE